MDLENGILWGFDVKITEIARIRIFLGGFAARFIKQFYFFGHGRYHVAFLIFYGL